MKIKKSIFMPVLALLILLNSCSSMKNPDKPDVPAADEGEFYTTEDNFNIFTYIFGKGLSNTSIYVISGYTGINHNNEKDVLSILSDNDENRIVVIHPRGTGYSDGKRGDVGNYDDFIGDYVEIINNDIRKRDGNDKVILYGHSISTAMCLVIADKLIKNNGIILINPPFQMKSSQGMTPGIWEYMKYAGYMIFAPHNTIVNMAGDPQKIENAQERLEAEQRNSDPLLVKYISMYMMIESKKILDEMVNNAKKMEAPLLLIYGSADSIIEKSGCDLIFDSWKGEKEYEIIENGPHGKQTVIMAREKIISWLKEIKN